MKDVPKISTTIATAGTTYSAATDLSIGDDDINSIETTLSVSALTGADTTLKITPQYSYDKVTWFDQPSDGQFSEVNASTTLPSAESLQLSFAAIYLRYKYVVAGATPSVTFDLYAVGKSL